MSTSAPLITSSLDLPALRTQLEILERRCAELWAAEPHSPSRRETALAQLADVEHRIVGLVLKSLAEPDDRDLLPAAQRCERDLNDTAALWSAPRAA
jgi:hypothetical protein